MAGGAACSEMFHGASYFGVLNHKASVNIVDSAIHDIGEDPFNGTQLGIAVYYTTVDVLPGSAVCSNQDAAQTGCTPWVRRRSLAREGAGMPAPSSLAQASDSLCFRSHGRRRVRNSSH